MHKRYVLEEGCPCCCKSKQQSANAKRRIPDPGCSQIGGLAIRRVGKDPDAVARRQLSNGNIKTRSCTNAREGGGRNHERYNEIVHEPETFLFSFNHLPFYWAMTTAHS